MNENENITLNELKAVLRGKIIAITAYFEKEVGSPINKLTSQLKKLDKNKQTKLETINKKQKARIKKEMLIIKIMAEINKIEN